MSSHSLATGIVFQLAGVLASACKYIFAHSVMRECKQDVGSPVTFLFWLDLLSLIILVPWAFAMDGEMYTLMVTQTSALDWAKLVRRVRRTACAPPPPRLRRPPTLLPTCRIYFAN